MESPEGVAAKRKVLVDVLTLCLQRSKVCEVVDPQTIRSVIESASTELWREGEFRLEYVWKILCQQPGLTAKEVAPPLLVFKAYETELGVRVRVPQALSALPRGEQVRLRDQLGIVKADFAKAIGELHALVQAEQQTAADSAAASDKAERLEHDKQPEAPSPGYGPRKPGKPGKPRRGLALALSGVAAVALAGSLYFGLRDTSKRTDLAETAPVLKLKDAVIDGTSLTAEINDPRWAPLTKPQREALANRVFDLVAARGIHAITLRDGSQHPKAVVSDSGGHRLTLVYP